MIYSNCDNITKPNKAIVTMIDNTLDIKTSSIEDLKLNIYSTEGRLMINELVSGNNQKDLSFLSKGIYILTLQSQTGKVNIVQKIIVK